MSVDFGEYNLEKGVKKVDGKLSTVVAKDG